MNFQSSVLRVVVALAISIGPISSFAQDVSFPNDSGWQWYVSPRPVTFGLNAIGDSTFIVLRDLPPRGTRIVLIGLSAVNDVVDIRPVVYDSSRNRFTTDRLASTSANKLWVRDFVVPYDRLAQNRVAAIGVEFLTEQNKRNAIIPELEKTLKTRGIKTLPYPEIGKPYTFKIAAVDGGMISSEALKGKVVLLDFWASWCGPCVKLLPGLKKTYAKLKKQGFEVIGVSIDESAAKTRQVILKEGLTWPTVQAPAEKEYHESWVMVAGISSVPRLLLIDRQGILRADVIPDELDVEIQKLVRER